MASLPQSGLSNRRILLGITGGIAAYKGAELCRRLQDQGAEIRVVMTAGAQEFIQPLTFQALTGNPVHTSLLDPAAEAAMGHIELARWADLILVAPASANFMARLAAGMADDLLSTLCLAARCPVAIAPAMNQAMWSNPATQHNLSLLEARNILRFGPDEGEQACGDVGPGRLLDPAILVNKCSEQFSSGQLLEQRVLITAGPTREALDPVRYISNHSSGKMGFELAAAAQRAGAKEVILVSGPVNLATPPGVTRINVTSAQQMLEEVMKQISQTHIFIATAAVADYRVAAVAEQKIKKTTSGDPLTLELVENPDILASVCALSPRPYTVGFAAETEKLATYARAKLKRKGADLIVANDVSDPSIGFNSDQNAVTLVWPDRDQSLPLASKRQIAEQIISAISIPTPTVDDTEIN